MTTAELKSIFENPYSRAEWISVLRDVFFAHNIRSNPETLTFNDNDFDAKGLELGSFETSEGLLVGLYEVSINPEKKLERNKVGLRNLLRKVYKNDVDAALIVFTQGAKWRFTYVSEITVVNKETGEREKRQTDPKRYTYVLGQHQLCRTPAERFAAIKPETDLFDTRISIKEIEKAFSVDLLTKDFYRELSNWYFWALQHVEFPDDAEKNQEIRNSTNTIRLITRLIFVWFLKQKGLVPSVLFEKDKIWPMLNPGYTGKSIYYKAILQNLFFATLNQEMDKRGFRKGKQHYNITNLFRYEKLFRDPGNALELFKGIPFLNGGLFECLDKPHPTEKTPLGAEKIFRVDGFSDRDDNAIDVPDFLFFGGADAVDLSMVYDDSRQKNLKVRGLIDILNSYNFTVEENTPLDIQVALDPELLGKVFENLLASYNPETKSTARKQTGSFYTPREIVQYMVDESLIAYLKQKLNKAGDVVEERNETKLRELLSYSGNGNPFNPEETRLLIEAIDQVKVLDPACGSGAFPMGVLQQMVHILQKLDPKNTEWKKIQMQRAQAELQDAIASGDADNFSDRIKEIAESFESNTEDYGRKLFLIENCIYGVDIQPIAVQIAKLRFFVSMLCEQTIQEEKENLGIKALPNLETKFVAANTLIALEKPVLGTGNIFLSDTQSEFEKLKKELNENRHKYFVAKRRDQKLKCHQNDKEVREKIAKLLVHEGWKTEIAKQVASYDPYDQNQHTDWFDPEWMLGVRNGFDIVIGNPPYLESRHPSFSDDLKKQYQINVQKRWQSDAKLITKGADLLVYFFESSISLINDNGWVILITQNAWLDTEYGKKTQDFLLRNTNVIAIIDSIFRYFPAGEGPNINTIISIFNGKKRKNDEVLKFITFFDNLENISTGFNLKPNKPVKNIKVNVFKNTDKILNRYKWGTLKTVDDFLLDVFNKLERKAVTLKAIPAATNFSFGQGLNLKKSHFVPKKIADEIEIDIQYRVPIHYSGAPFILNETDWFLIDKRINNQLRNKLNNQGYSVFDKSGTKKEPPVLILPRGISKHFCSLNMIDAYSLSGVDVYSSKNLVLQKEVINLWCYFNSSLFWLIREISGRKNLGGGLLKSEAADLVDLPVYIELSSSSIEIIDKFSRNAFNTIKEIETPEHKLIDQIVFDALKFNNYEREKIKNYLIDFVETRTSKSKT